MRHYIKVFFASFFNLKVWAVFLPARNTSQDDLVFWIFTKPAVVYFLWYHIVSIPLQSFFKNQPFCDAAIAFKNLTGAVLVDESRLAGVFLQRDALCRNTNSRKARPFCTLMPQAHKVHPCLHKGVTLVNCVYCRCEVV